MVPLHLSYLPARVDGTYKPAHPDLALRWLQVEDSVRLKLIKVHRAVKRDLIHPNSRPITWKDRKTPLLTHILGEKSRGGVGWGSVSNFSSQNLWQ